MQNTYALLDIDLQLFDGAAGGAAAGTAGDGAAQGDASALPKAEKSPGSSRRGKTGAYDNVVFGKQEDAPQTAATAPGAGEHAEGNGKTTTSDSKEAKQKAFRELITGEYKEEYTREFDNYFNRRFKETKGMESALAAQKPIMDLLVQRYGVKDGDMGKLLSAIENDNVYWEDAAEEAGMTVEQFKAMQKLERENIALAEERRMREEADRRAAREKTAQQKMNDWYTEAEQVKQLYPGFDFNAECNNRDFLDLLRKGIKVQQAYELVHRDEINAAIAKNAAQTAGQQMVAKIQNKASRPVENGTSSQSAVVIKSDVHSLSKSDRAEAARRAMRGEKIRW